MASKTVNQALSPAALARKKRALQARLSPDQKIYLAKRQTASFGMNLITFLLIIGLCFVILYPFIQLVPTVLSAVEDLGNPNVIWIPEKFSTVSFQAAARMTMPEGIMTMVKSLGFALVIMAIQVFISTMTGYTMARVKYRFSGLLFVLVALCFLVPRQSLLLAQYIYFNHFDALGILRIFGVEWNLINQPATLYMMALLGFGVNQSLFVLIFSQFFKNIPRELEEAALIDGCGFYRTYFRIMLPNAVPAIVTVAILAFVWNYGDTYYTRYFDPTGPYMASKLATTFIDANKVTLLERVRVWYGVPVTSDMTFDALKQAGILIFLAPLLVLYLFAQRWLVENLESSGLVG